MRRNAEGGGWSGRWRFQGRAEAVGAREDEAHREGVDGVEDLGRHARRLLAGHRVGDVDERVAHAHDEARRVRVDARQVGERRRLAQQLLPHVARELEGQRRLAAQADADERAEQLELPQRGGRDGGGVEHALAAVGGG